MFSRSLGRPIPIETAVRGSLSIWSWLVTYGKFARTLLHRHTNIRRIIARIPLASVDFPLTDMSKYCHTEASYGSLSQEETRKLAEKCHDEGVTMTSAISSAILCIASTLVNDNDNQTTQLTLAIAADTRRRCVPPILSHNLSHIR